ncbi:MAG: hypothetical protein AAF236_01955 [Verrucomicrobiota bacterium]
MKLLFQKLPRFVWVLIGLIAFGLCRVPVERNLREQLIETHLLIPPPGQSARQQMSQSALMGLLGGLRSLLASFLVLKAHEEFSFKQWDDLRSTYEIVTNLEPRDESHWTSVIWHIGINATANMQIDESIPKFERDRRFQEYALEALAIGDNALEQLPESVDIRMQMVEVYREKLRDDCGAAKLYGEIVKLPDQPAFAKRFWGYFRARCPGEEREDYEYLFGLYAESKGNHLPTLIKEIKILEEELAVPLYLRITDPDPDTLEGRPMPDIWRPWLPSLLPGGIILP